MILRIGALIVIVMAILIAADALIPEESQRKFKTLFLSDEQKTLYAECENARKKLHEQGLPTLYSEVEFRVRNARLEKDPILGDLKKCFQISKKSPVKLEIETFSSDYESQSSADLQVQISAIDTKTSNKIAEVGFRMDHKPYSENSAKDETTKEPVKTQEKVNPKK